MKGKNTYPIILTKGQKYVLAYIPDFDMQTQGTDLTDAIEMARDAIGLVGIDMEDDHKPLPEPSDYKSIRTTEDELLTLVDVDFVEYRFRNESRTVKKNCTIPGWLCYEAVKAHLNFSQVLQNALKRELRITAR